MFLYLLQGLRWRITTVRHNECPQNYYFFFGYSKWLFIFFVEDRKFYWNAVVICTLHLYPISKFSILVILLCSSNWSHQNDLRKWLIFVIFLMRLSLFLHQNRCSHPGYLWNDFEIIIDLICMNKHPVMQKLCHNILNKLA